MSKRNPWRERRELIKHPKCIGCGCRISPEQAARVPVCESCQKRADSVLSQEVVRDL